MKKNLIKNVFKRILILESKINQFRQLVSKGKMPQDILDGIWNDEVGKWIEPFNDDEYRKILFNSFDQDQAHDLDYFQSRFEEISRKVIRPMRSNRMSLPVQEIPGVAVIDLNPRIKPKFLLTIDECDQYINAIEETDSKSKKLKDVLYKGLAQGEKTNFEVVYKDENIIVVYPKTYLGSIATARMGPDFRYYTPPNVIGALNWCTSIASGNNMFLNYHRRLNLHMYYITKLGNNYNTTDRFRKACVSVAKRYGNVSLTDNSSATVDGNNTSLKKKEIIDAYGDKIFSIILNDASDPSRKEINETEYYKSITLSQFKTLESAAIQDNEQLSISLFLREAKAIAQNTQKIELLRYLVDIKDYYALGHRNYASMYDIPLSIADSVAQNPLSVNERILIIEDILHHRLKSGKFEKVDRDNIFSTLQKMADMGDDKTKNVIISLIKENNNPDLIEIMPLILGYESYLDDPRTFAIAISESAQKGIQELNKILGYRGYDSKPKNADEALKALYAKEKFLLELIDVVSDNTDEWGYRSTFAATAAAFLIAKLQYSRNVNEFVPEHIINATFIQRIYSQLHVYSWSNKAMMAVYYAVMRFTKEKAKNQTPNELYRLGNLIEDVFFPKSDNLDVSNQQEVQRNMLSALFRLGFLEIYVKHVEKGEIELTLNYFRGLLKHAKIIKFPRMTQLKLACTEKIARLGLDLDKFVRNVAMRDKLGPDDVQSLETLPGEISLMTVYLEDLFKEEIEMRQWRPDEYE